MTEQAENTMIKRGNMEWNLNTLLQLGSIASILIVGGMAWQSVKGDIETINTWKISQEELHRERLVYFKEIEGKFNERFRALETDSRKQDNTLEALSIRQSMTEQSQTTMLQTLKEIQASFVEYSSEQKVQREILQRIEATLKSPR